MRRLNWVIFGEFQKEVIYKEVGSPGDHKRRLGVPWTENSREHLPPLKEQGGGEVSEPRGREAPWRGCLTTALTLPERLNPTSYLLVRETVSETHNDQLLGAGVDRG